MINIDELAIMANRKEEENLRFRTYLKGHADDKELDKQYITVKIVEIAVRN